MPDMQENLKHNGSLTNNKGVPEKMPSFIARTFQSKCSQCRNEKATGSVRMEDDKWYKVCNSCRRTLGVKGRKGQQSYG